MPQTHIAQNLRRLRGHRRLTQQALADQSGLSRVAYRNIETGKSAPRTTTLQAIAAALQVPVEQLVAPVTPLRAVRFRSTKRVRDREQILVDVGRWLEGFVELEQMLGDHIAPGIPQVPGGTDAAPDHAATAAGIAREALGLSPSEPVRDICGLLEAAGVKVRMHKLASHQFFGLSVAARDGGPAIVVNTWERISVERWIFTAAHELGHLVLHQSDYDASETTESDEREREANAFAAAFLMPEAAFRRKWEETRGLALIDRVLKVKRIFRVSYRTVLFRLAPDYRGQVSIWVRFQMDHKRRHGRTLLREDEPRALERDAFQASLPESNSAAEPAGLCPIDFSGSRLARLVRRAVEQDLISLGRGAEILELSLSDMRTLAASWVA